MAEPFGLVLALFGIPGVVWPYEMARFGEQLDAIGSKRSMGEVEPAGWNVTLTQVMSVGMVLVGLWLFFFTG